MRLEKKTISMLLHPPKNLCIHSQNFCGINNMRLEEKVSQENAVILQENSKVWRMTGRFLVTMQYFFTSVSI